MITVITTFSKQGYEVYGKRWMSSVERFWPKDTKVIIYTDFELDAPAANFTIKQFDTEFPSHASFKDDITKFFNSSEKSIDIGRKTIKFSYKGFVICKELEMASDGYLIWLDGDAETINNVSVELLGKIIDGKFLACQQEKNNKHVESGILFFNVSLPMTQEFSKEISRYYFNKELLKLKKPYDGYVIADILKNKQYDYTDLNAAFKFADKKSKKEDTFLHPLLKSYFVHWIGTVKG